MSGKITSFLREYVLIFSIILTIVGLIVFFMGVIWTLFGTAANIDFINDLGEGNTYLLFIGFIILVAGIYYLYAYLKNKKFVLEELKINKKSEFIKRHVELKNVVKHMPKKYKKMLKDKEKELKIK